MFLCILYKIIFFYKVKCARWDGGNHTESIECNDINLIDDELVKYFNLLPTYQKYKIEELYYEKTGKDTVNFDLIHKNKTLKDIICSFLVAEINKTWNSKKTNVTQYFYDKYNGNLCDKKL
ncbi:hypothetical protein EHP00_2316 [Ecytonucleospora hepatopenaei]|uniref:Uncharacterized protein n=1 Tax=Ecytonucleospora hepatopenaei TaxID=646526 RepID=A0A1W0E3C5_9MICR|nr:hypothetical protein EHP00_2316 [Ecytonucleospora hepatopenaei]